MHKSRLQALVIDCGTDQLDGDAAFWGAALGCKVFSYNAEPEDENYRGLEVDPSQPLMLVQKVSHPSRVHLDIETDDIDAEVARLGRLGAKKVGQVRDFSILEAPSGHRFCVVPVQRPDFYEKANIW
ncbi:VOC family protein [Chromohalobacter sarecensis]|uniref:VOC family protein n=1 Tax=Chromohalobacter sarecensis TaxID=245294 RepID=A0ABV9D3R0_9GAMM